MPTRVVQPAQKPAPMSSVDVDAGKTLTTPVAPPASKPTTTLPRGTSPFDQAPMDQSPTGTPSSHMPGHG